MKTADGTNRPLKPLNKLQSIVLGERVRLTRSECIELVDWIWSLEEEVLAARQYLAKDNVDIKNLGTASVPDNDFSNKAN